RVIPWSKRSCEKRGLKPPSPPTARRATKPPTLSVFGGWSCFHAPLSGGSGGKYNPGTPPTKTGTDDEGERGRARGSEGARGEGSTGRSRRFSLSPLCLPRSLALRVVVDAGSDLGRF